MKFFKRSVMLRPSGDAERAIKTYRAYLATIVHLLPVSAREFDRKSRLHDSVVSKIGKSGAGLIMELDLFKLDFSGVSRFVAPPDALNERLWLYSEVDAAPRGRFVLRVLMDEGELEVEAATISL